METLVKKFKKFGTADLLKKVEKLTGADKDACIAVLTERGQDVSKWATIPELVPIPEPVETISEGEEITPEEEIVFEDETPLTPEQEEALKTASQKESVKGEAIKEDKLTLLEKAQQHFDKFKKGTEGYSKIVLITRARKLSKMSPEELKLIIAVPFKVEVVRIEAPKSAGTTKPVKADKSQTESKEVKGLKVGSSVEFKSSGRAKNPNKMLIGTVLKFDYDKANKEFIQIESDGKFWKRSTSVTLK